MSKINRLKIALKTGAFWGMFKSPPAINLTANRWEFEAESRNLWDKYRDLVWRYGNVNARFMVLYDAHRRDLMRLIKKHETR